MTPQTVQKIEKLVAAGVLGGVVAALHAAGNTDLAQEVTVLGAALLGALGLGSVNTPSPTSKAQYAETKG